MSGPDSYGLCALARELQLPESTTRYYRDVFAQYVPTVGSGRKRRYPAEAVSVLRYIADSFAEGLTRYEIEASLAERTRPAVASTQRERPSPIDTGTGETPDRILSSFVESEREQRELMWQMVRELSRFGDAIERQHYILSELVERVFHGAERRLPSADNGDGGDTIIDAEIVSETAGDSEDEPDLGSSSSGNDIDALRKALDAERDLVRRLRKSKLDLERRAAAAEAELESTPEQEPGLLRRILYRGRGR